MQHYNFYDPIVKFAAKYPVMGTCAGLIMLSREVDDEKVKPLGLIDIKTSRNAYGRQIDSFVSKIDFQGDTIDAYFIRAPKIIQIFRDTEILAKHEDQCISVKKENIFGLTFHPELGNNRKIHEYFLKEV